MRPLCQCGFRPAAVNYKKGKKTYYRRQCEVCLHHGKIKYGIPRWMQAGYKKQSICEKCGFKSTSEKQLDVFHIDGDMNNCRHNNLKTVCANCNRLIHVKKQGWRQGDLTADR